MFDKSFYLGGDTTNVRCEVKLNTPSTGFIQRSNPVSRFIRFQRGSEIEAQLFPVDPRKSPRLEYSEERTVWDYGSRVSYHRKTETTSEEVVVLQVCVFGADYMLAEYVFKKDLNATKSE
jgi:hypothetical protein